MSKSYLFIHQREENGRMMLDSIDNEVYLTVEENGYTRPKKYFELTEAQQLQDDCDVQATNIILHGLPPDMYALVNHQEEMIQLNASTKQWHSYLLWHQGFHLQTINSEHLPIPEIRQPFKMEESLFNKFKEDNLEVLLALETEELLQPQRETMQLTEDLDAYNLDCDDISSAKAVLMVNLLSCDLDVLSESQDAGIHDTNSSTPNDLLVLSLAEQMTDHEANLDNENKTNKMVNESLIAELEIYK
uniref:Integrase, catalytic region, zinc finger, CCHC-type, peptidase aspartic, catalytic n=1 Tax=Tanacetum cinerariifolium TaxID=118510 RepID=A0A6L2JN51_TANCI|nr:hypothetical protein [Tanacetum cinerariifolium]